MEVIYLVSAAVALYIAYKLVSAILEWVIDILSTFWPLLIGIISGIILWVHFDLENVAVLVFLLSIWALMHWVERDRGPTSPSDEDPYYLKKKRYDKDGNVIGYEDY